MVKDKTAALERAKKATVTVKGKKTSRGLSSRSRLPPGWIQGDWIWSTIRKEDLATAGLIADGSWRLLIRLNRIYNFLLFHAIILPLLDVYGLYFTHLYHFWD